MEIASVKMVKLVIIPSVTPRGLNRPFPAIVLDNTIGSSGQIHGAKIVTSPERKAKTINKSIRLLYQHFWEAYEKLIHSFVNIN